LLCMISNTLWMILGLLAGSVGLVISSIFSVAIHTRGWLKWRQHAAIQNLSEPDSTTCNTMQ
jgi:hypothetical protein